MAKLIEREGVRRGNPVAAAPALAVQFFLIPLAVVAAVVLVYAGFRLLLEDERTPQEYLNDIRIGGRERRWPAAYELSRLMADPEVERADPTLGPALVKAFEESTDDDPRVRRYLALAVGRLRTPPASAVDRLVAALDDPDSEIRISVIWALGALGDSGVVPELQRMYRSDDAGIRKMTVYTLGALPGEAQTVTLRTALNDPAPDVQWNAAVALARHGNATGVGVLRRMLDRAYLTRTVDPASAGADSDRVGDVMISGVQAAASLKAQSLRETILRLSREDESLRVRQAALKALEAMGPQAGADRSRNRRLLRAVLQAPALRQKR